ncbi:MAG: Tat pathway signal protein [Chromatiales bacterium]|jgi:hypothetical protein|nr:Tat pathway signal protein [Chromatiales bacterium]
MSNHPSRERLTGGAGAPPLSRRRLLALAAGAPLAGSVLAGCARPDAAHDAAVAETWRHTVEDTVNNRDELEREIVRYATLAPSHRNRQPWRFELGPGWIIVRPDIARRLPVADPDDRYLHAAVGAAAETMVTAAAAGGLGAKVSPDGDGIRIDFFVSLPQPPQLYDAIIARQTAWEALDAAPLEEAEVGRLEKLAAGAGIVPRLVTERAEIDRVLKRTIEAAEHLARDPAWLRELIEGLRFDAAEALATRDGLFTVAAGYPGVPRWLGTRLPDLVTTPGRERERATAQLNGCSGVIVFAADDDSPAAWQEAGRCYQRVALVAQSRGIRTGPVNAALDVPEVRGRLSRNLGLGERRPVLALRFGRGGATLPRSLRRPAADLTTGQG